MELIRELGRFPSNEINKATGHVYMRKWAVFKCPVCGKEVNCLRYKGLKQTACSYSCAHKSHEQSGTRFYNIWQAMKQRCENPNNPKYNIYGGKGIKVCPQWQSFEGFLKDNASLYAENLTIDRIDPSKDYCPENIHWVTLSENSAKTSRLTPVKQFRIVKVPEEHYEFIKEWPTARKAGLELGLVPAHITRCCQGHTKTHGGYHWEYAN